MATSVMPPTTWYSAASARSASPLPPHRHASSTSAVVRSTPAARSRSVTRSSPAASCADRAYSRPPPVAARASSASLQRPPLHFNHSATIRLRTSPTADRSQLRRKNRDLRRFYEYFQRSPHAERHNVRQR